MLNAMRFGRLDSKTTEAFKALSRKVIYTDGIEPTELCVSLFSHITISHHFSFSTRQEVDNANLSRLKQLNTNPYTYNAMEYPGIDSKGERVTREHMERLLERLVVPKSLQLKV
jgi:ATP-dependent DNA helicase PIF1